MASETPQACAASSQAVIEPGSTPGGHIANIVTEETSCGSLDCPWLLRAPPGQSIKLTLHDFAVFSRDLSGFIDDIPRVCHVYAVLKEESIKASETICASNVRTKWVYTSVTNSMEIRIVSKNKNAYFVLEYEGKHV